MIGTTISIDAATDDLAIPFALITGLDAYRQRLTHRFEMGLGEWFLDLRIGAPWYEYVFLKNPDRRIITTVLRQIVESTPGTLRINKLNFTIDGATRHLVVDELDVTLTDDETFFSQGQPFIIKLGQ